MNSLWTALCRHAASRPNDPALLCYAGSVHVAYTWIQMMEAVSTLSEQLRQDGVEVAALHGANSPGWVIVDLACHLAGIVLIPLPDFFSPEQLRHVLSEVPVDTIFTDRAAVIAPLNPRTLTNRGRLLDFDYLRSADCNEGWRVREQHVLPPGTQKVTFTSGSTGKPKGVCLSAAHQQRVADSIVAATASSNITTHLCLLPLSVLLENIAGVYAPLKRGASVVLSLAPELGFNGFGDFSLRRFLQALNDCQPDSVILMPQLLHVLVEACEGGWSAPASLQFMAVGGGTVSPALTTRGLACGLPIHEGYGLSECGSVVSLNTVEKNRPGTLGRVLPHAKVTVVDGEFVVEGSIFLGYVSDRASWHLPDSAGNSSNSCTYRTGDLGWIDGDGFLHFAGRSKNLIITSHGRKINPEWLESELILEQAIGQCIVFGDARPGCVALVVAAGSAAPPDIAAAIERVNGRLPAYARLIGWHQLECPLLPGSGQRDDLMTSNGRPRRTQIEQRFASEIDSLYATYAAQETLT